jgi:hypothetical protein
VVKIGDLFQKVLVTDQGLAETEILTDTQNGEEDKRAPNGKDQNEAKDGENPSQDIKITLVTRELIKIHREIKYSQQSQKQIGNDLPDTAQHSSHKGKKPTQKSIHSLNLDPLI